MRAYRISSASDFSARLIVTIRAVVTDLRPDSDGDGSYVPSEGKKIILAALFAALLLVGVWTACGGGNGSSNHVGSSGTPRGQYTVMVNATSGSVVHSTAVTITVQ